MGLIQRKRCLLLWLCAVVLASCTGGTDQINSTTARFGELRGILLAQRDQAELPNVDRALLDSLTLASLEVTIEARDALAYLIPAGSRQDGLYRVLNIWRTGDNAQVVMHNGVIVTTRGLGNDLQGADRRGIADAINGQGPDFWPTTLTVITPAQGARTITLTCSIETPRRKTIEIVELTFQVDHLRETCTGDADAGTVVNEFWIDAQDRTVWQSRQWVGPDIGYLRTRLLKKL